MAMRGIVQNWLAAGLGLAVLLAGCGPQRPEGGPLAVTVIGDPDGRDSLAQRLAAEATQPTLIARDGSGESVAGLATSWRFVDDGRSLILRLRPMKWSDGAPLVAADVVASFRRAAARHDPLVADAGLANAAAIARGALPSSRLGVLAPIARVVEIRLDAPSPLLLAWLAEPGLGVTRAAPTTRGAAPATLAAYVASGTTGHRVLKRLTMTATPDARPAEIRIDTSADITATLAAFAGGRQDIIIGEGLAGLGEARGSARAESLRLDPVWGFYGYLVNGLRGATADAGVRSALAMAIDRQALASDFGIAAIQPAVTLVPPATGQPDADAAPAWTRLDDTARRAEAQRLLGLAGWSTDHPLRLVLLLPAGRDHRAVAEKVGADWAGIGVQLAVTQVDAKAYARLLARGEYDLAVTETNPPVPDALAQLARFRCGAGPYCNPDADALLAAARTAAPIDRAALLVQAEMALLAAPPAIPLFSPIRWALVSRRVDGWLPNAAASHPLARLAAGK